MTSTIAPNFSVALYDRILGALWGVATGDALGATVEFMKPDAIAARYGTHSDIIGGGAFSWRPGQGTDDTDLTYATLRAYINEPFPTLNAFSNQYLDWYRTNPRDIGGTTRTALTTLNQTSDPTTSGCTNERSQGNGSLMRAIPTALIHRHNQQARERDSATISAITHAHPNCIDSCIAYNNLAAQLICGQPIDTAIARTLKHTTNPDVHAALSVDADTPVEEIATTGWVIDSLRAATWAIQQNDLEPTLIALINRGDDADTTGAIAGGLLGASHGATSIPTRWIERLEYRDTLAAAATAVLNQTGRTLGSPTSSQTTPAAEPTLQQ